MGRAKLTDVPGLGKRFAGRLRLAGLGSLQKLAAASPNDLEPVKGIARERAAAFIEAARVLVGERAGRAATAPARTPAAESPPKKDKTSKRDKRRKKKRDKKKDRKKRKRKKKKKKKKKKKN